MFRNWLTALAAPLVAVAALAFSSGPALAAHGPGGGGHGGFHGGGFHGAAFHGGGFHGGGFHGTAFRGGGFRGAGFRGGGWRGGYGWNRGYRGWGWNRGYGGWGGWGWPWYGWGGWGWPWYGSYGYYPSYYYGYSPSYYDYSTYPYTDYTYPYSYSYVPSTTDYSYYSPASAAASNTVELNVQVPADAQVWIDGYKTTQTGTLRHYTSPPLTPGTNYSYDIRARWMDNGKPVERDKKVAIHAGEEINMNMMEVSASH
jgi:uncharacterized protein (TIGR03000 family)